MKILFITDNFYPERNAPAKRTFEHCKNWVNQNNSVTIITGVPNFPTGKVFSGYKNKIYQSEIINNIFVKRVWTYMHPNKGFLLRIIDYVSFMFSSFICGLFTKKHDVIIATSPQFFTLISGYLISIFKRTPLVIEIRDLWPESIVTVGVMKKSNIFIKILHRIAIFIYKKAKIIICVTNSFKKDLIKKGIEKEKIFIIQNGFDLEKNTTPNKKIEQIENEYQVNQKDFIVAFIGTVGIAHGLQIILRTAKKIDKSVKFLIIGDGAEKDELMKKAEEKLLDNVIFIPNISWQEIVNINQIINMHLIHLINSPEFKKVIPSKIFESMALKKPIIMGVKGESREITNNANCSLNITPENHLELVELINNHINQTKYLKNLGLNGNKFLKDNFSRKIMSNKMIEFLKDAI